MFVLTLYRLFAGGNRIAAAHRGTLLGAMRTPLLLVSPDSVAKAQRLLLSRNAFQDSVSYLAELLGRRPPLWHVDVAIMCGFDHTCGENTTGRDMNYLSLVAEQRPMLRVSGEIVLAFCCATPLVLLLCFLV